MSRFSVRKPYTVFVAVIAVLVFGFISYRNMTPDLLPNMDFPYVVVVTTYPGATPEQVETTVTRPLEQALATLNDLKTITSDSSGNYSMISLEFEQNANLDAITVDMLQSIQTLDESWDDMVGEPLILKINPGMIPVTVSAVAMEGMDRYELAEFVEETILPELEGTTGVAGISADGMVERTMTLSLSEQKMDAMNDKIADALMGSLKDARQQLDDAQKELDNAKATVNGGLSQLRDAPNQMLSSLSLDGAGEELNDLKGLLQDTASTNIQLSAAQVQQQALLTEKEMLEQSLQQMEDSIREQETELAGIESDLEVCNRAIGAAGFLTPDITPLALMGLDSDTLSALQSQGCITLGDVRTRAAGLEMLQENMQASVVSARAAAEEARKAADLRLPEIATETEARVAEIAELQAKAEANAAAIAAYQSGIQDLPKTLISGITDLSLAGGQLAAAQSSLSSAQETLDKAYDSYDEQVEAALEAADLHNVLSLQAVAAILGAQNFDMPAGYVYKNDESVVVTVGDGVKTREDMENMILMDLCIGDLEPIRVKDVADIVYSDNADEMYATLNNGDGVILMFSKQSTYATAKVTDNIQKACRALEEEYPGLEFVALMDQGDYIYMMRDSILSSLLWGALFSVVVLFLFLRDWKPTVITLCSIPISLLFAITLMYFSGVTINVISLSGLAVSVGMLVDNSVVVIENTYRLRALGESPVKAAVSGAGQVAGAVFASTLTTVCVFVPILFTNGMARQIFMDMMLTLSFALLASLIVALTLVPAMAQGMLRRLPPHRETAFDRFMPKYKKAVLWSVKHKAAVILGSLALLLVSAGVVLLRGFAFLPDMSMDQMMVMVNMPEGSTFEETTAMADEITARILTVDGVGTVGATVPSESAGMSMTNMGAGDVNYYLLLSEDTKRSGSQVAADINAVCADLPCEVIADTSSLMSTYTEMLSGSGVTVRLFSKDNDALEEAAALVSEKLLTVEGISSASTPDNEITPEIHFTVNKEKAAKEGLTVAQVYQQVMLAVTGETEITTIDEGAASYTVILRVKDKRNITPGYLETYRFTVTDSQGKEHTLRLNQIADFSWGESPSTIHRINQRRYLDVTGEVDDEHNITLVAAAVEAALKDTELPLGVTMKLTGEQDTIMDAMKDLGILMVVGILLVYLVMVAQFQNLKSPFIVMFTIPLAFTGGFLGLLLCNMELNILSMLGMIMLVGIIVNNGIVLVDYINQLREGGTERREAIAEAAVTRLRPILMTSITTILGLAVMALGQSESAALMQPLAVTCIGGLTYATLMTLFVVPAMYDVFAGKHVRTVREEDLELSEK